MRSPCCDNDNLKKGPWTPEEDQKLVDYINKHGYGSWRSLPKLAGLNRCGKSCRLRWTNYLRPDIKRGRFSEDEERLIINLHSVLGNKWSRIASHLPGRTDNEIKNFWNTHIRKKLLSMGLDPTTHKPRTDLDHLLSLSQLLHTAPLGNLMNSWDNNTLRLQTDSAQLAKLQLVQNLLQIINTTPVLNINESILLGHQNNPNPFQGLINRTSSNYTHELDLQAQPSLVNSGLNIPQATNDQQAITNSWSGFEGGLLDPEGLDFVNDNNSLTDPYHSQPESKLPQLVSVSPETTTINQLERNGKTSYLSTSSSPVSGNFEAWEKLLMDDDEISGSYWQNILDFTSSPSSPVSW